MSQPVWASSAAATASTETQPGEAAAHIKLNSLREAALTILGELESLGISQPVEINPAPCTLRLYEEVRKFEIHLIRNALNRTGGSQTRAAKLLGVKLTTLNSKIKRYRIMPFAYDSPMDQEVTGQQSAA